MAETLLKSMSFKMPIETIKKKFFPSEDTLNECFNLGVEYSKLIK
jgi:flavorubredoxin